MGAVNNNSIVRPFQRLEEIKRIAKENCVDFSDEKIQAVSQFFGKTVFETGIKNAPLRKVADALDEFTRDCGQNRQRVTQYGFRTIQNMQMEISKIVKGVTEKKRGRWGRIALAINEFLFGTVAKMKRSVERLQTVLEPLYALPREAPEKLREELFVDYDALREEFKEFFRVNPSNLDSNFETAWSNWLKALNIPEEKTLCKELSEMIAKIKNTDTFVQEPSYEQEPSYVREFSYIYLQLVKAIHQIEERFLTHSTGDQAFKAYRKIDELGQVNNHEILKAVSLLDKGPLEKLNKALKERQDRPIIQRDLCGVCRSLESIPHFKELTPLLKRLL